MPQSNDLLAAAASAIERAGEANRSISVGTTGPDTLALQHAIQEPTEAMNLIIAHCNRRASRGMEIELPEQIT